MPKAGDRVRFLNAIGGGTITRIDGKTAFVEDEDGFESPVLLKDIVVVLPADHVAEAGKTTLMFNQKAFDEGRKIESSEPKSEEKKVDQILLSESEETPYGDNPNLVLAFEPQDIKRLGNSSFTAVLVNDSNFKLDFIFLRRSAEERGWSVVFNGSVQPNELIDLAVLSHEDLPLYEKIAFQCIAYKEGKEFSLIPPINGVRRIDLTKFHKFHCFRPSIYFDGAVLEFPLVLKGKPVTQISSSDSHTESNKENKTDLSKELSKKYKIDSGKNQVKKNLPSDNPNRLLPLIEIDLHIGELLDSTSGMEPKDILDYQLGEVRKTMESHKRRIGQKIVFIHGKGEGVLRKSVLDLLKREYPKAELQDASFREYGFGATLVTIH